MAWHDAGGLASARGASGEKKRWWQGSCLMRGVGAGQQAGGETGGENRRRGGAPVSGRQRKKKGRWFCDFPETQGSNCKTKFSVDLGDQMKKCSTLKLCNFLRSTTFLLCRFSLDQSILKYFEIHQIF